MEHMTKRFLSLSSLRALAASRRRGHLAGSSWWPIRDRDLDRAASDLLFVSQVEPVQLTSDAKGVARPVTSPVDLSTRRAGGVRPSNPGPTAGHARAS